MNNKLPMAVLCAALAGWIGHASAEDIYRCGDSYSQKPCPGGKLVQVEDARSAGQKSQTDQAAQRDARNADAMEKARLKEEAKVGRDAPAPAKPQQVAQGDKEPVAGKTKKPEHFTAVSPRKPGDAAAKKKKKKAKKKDS